ncbi:MAG: FKBP-type peptidyl-prolyl cis-trans isomerase [Hymenobacter sp.]
MPLALLGLLAAGLLTTACKKDTTSAVPDFSAADDATITKYLATNSITTAQKQTSGLYYVPLVTNTAAQQATVGMAASVRYTGKLLNGTVFGASSLHNNRISSFRVGDLVYIQGLEQGVSLMHLGDSATFLGSVGASVWT